ncbi:hypothetical protein MKX03_006627 [Papaver bracteatum]|nr:hypothetical protein MKX03_006627 [Papaver bracteatum]
MAAIKQEEQQNPNPPKLQIYPTASTGISPFWKEKYEKDAKKYWDVFYKRHQDKFFKDRHYLDKEWGHYFKGDSEAKTILEIGCGAGNTIFPLVATYRNIFVHACDFSPRAVNLVKLHKEFTSDRVNAFVCDLTADDISEQIPPSSVDIVTMIFVLSAVSPEKMTMILQNIRKILKPNGLVLLRDYAVGDLAQERLTCKDQMISENFYVRGDGTRAFYFSEEFLTSLFNANGFDTEEIEVYCKQVENRSRELVMNRRWIQSVFRFTDGVKSSHISGPGKRSDLLDQHANGSAINGTNNLKEPKEDIEIDMSESIAVEMFSITPSIDDDNHEIIKIELGEHSFSLKGLSKEHQHTCKSTGLMLWESARLISAILAQNPSIVEGKRVLELGSGCMGVCSMIAARYAESVYATDGDTIAVELLNQNVVSNLKEPVLNKVFTKRLEWGNRDEIETIKKTSPSGFDVIIGTDVTYVAEAISPLFETANELITSSNGNTASELKPALILCHIFRRVDEASILSTASKFGFKLVDRWPGRSSVELSQNVVSSWFSSSSSYDSDLTSLPLHILYFHHSK